MCRHVRSSMRKNNSRKWYLSSTHRFVIKRWEPKQESATGYTQTTFVNSFFRTKSHSFVDLLSVVVFMLLRQGWVVATETVWPLKPKALTARPLTECVCWPLPDIKQCRKLWKISTFCPVSNKLITAAKEGLVAMQFRTTHWTTSPIFSGSSSLDWNALSWYLTP